MSKSYKLACLSAALAWPGLALAGPATSGTLPDPAQATFLLTDPETGGAAGEVRQCLTDLGMKQAEAPAYLVQFSRVTRLRKAAVEQSAKDAAGRPKQAKPLRGKTIEVASLAFVEVASGRIVYQAEVARKVRRKPAKTALVSDLCSVLKGPAAPNGAPSGAGAAPHAR